MIVINANILCSCKAVNISPPRCRSTHTKGLLQPVKRWHIVLLKLKHQWPRRLQANFIARRRFSLILGHFSYCNRRFFFWLRGRARSLKRFWFCQLSTSVARFSVMIEVSCRASIPKYSKMDGQVVIQRATAILPNLDYPPCPPTAHYITCKSHYSKMTPPKNL